jgi:hypothetical protein
MASELVVNVVASDELRELLPSIVVPSKKVT